MPLVSKSRSLAKATFVGVSATVLQTVAGRFTGLGSQLAAAYFLSPEQFGTVALALTLVAVTGVLQSSGLAEVLINRRKAFRAWAPDANALALKLGLSAGLLTITTSPLVAKAYGDSQIMALGLIYGVAQIVHAFSVVPVARLQAELKFVGLAKCNFLSNLTSAITLVLAAILGFGALSFPLGRLGQSIVLTGLSLRMSPSSSHRSPKPARQWFLLSEATVFLLISLTATICLQADYFALRCFHSAEVVGIYYFAFSIAGKTSQLIGGSVTSVVHPVLANAQGDPSRQSRITLQLISLVATLGYPLAFIQAAAMPLIFHLVLPLKWLPSMTMTQIMSIGLGVNMVSGIGWGLLKIQRNMKLLLTLNTTNATIFTLAALGVSFWLQPIAMAVLLVLFCIVYTQTLLGFVWSALGLRWTAGVLASSRPFIVSALTAAALYKLMGFGTEKSIDQIPLFIINCGLFAAITYGLLLVTNPDLWNQTRPVLQRLHLVR